jgi:hypothetical protein
MYTRVLPEKLRGKNHVVDIGIVVVEPRLLAELPKSGQDIFLFPTASMPVVGPIQPTNHFIWEDFSAG